MVRERQNYLTMNFKKEEEESGLGHKLFVERGKDLLKFSFFLGLNFYELDPKCIGLNPSHFGLVNPQRPVKPWDIDAALIRSPCDHWKVCFDHTAAGREVSCPPLAFLLPARNSASEL
jgi:hypothetical protein